MTMMDKIQRMRQLKDEVENPQESERLRALAGILAEIETAQREAVMDQREALGVEPGDGAERLDREERTDAILRVIDGYGPSGPSLAEVWLAECGPEGIDVEDASDLSHYAQLSDEEWQQQVQRWAEGYRSQVDGTIGATDRELADKHVRERFGVPLERFEAEVVEFDRETAMRDLLAGPSETTEQAIRETTEALA